MWNMRIQLLCGLGLFVIATVEIGFLGEPARLKWFWIVVIVGAIATSVYTLFTMSRARKT